MLVVVEGPDNSGKSTMISALSNMIPGKVIIKESEGPEKWPGEINERIRAYRFYYGANCTVIFDRHPCVSQPIYGQFRNNTPVEAHLVTEFYEQRPIFIYCRPLTLTLAGHVEKEHDSEEHLRMVAEWFAQLDLLYSQWANRHAFITYRMGDDITRIACAIGGIIRG